MSRPTDHEETIEHLRDIAGAIRDTITAKDDAPPLAEPYPAIDFTPARFAVRATINAADRAQLRGLAALLIERTVEVLRIPFDRANLDFAGVAAATTAATTALLACADDDLVFVPPSAEAVEQARQHVAAKGGAS